MKLLRTLVVLTAATACPLSALAALVAEFNFNAVPTATFTAWIDNAATTSTTSAGLLPLGSPFPPQKTGSAADLNPVTLSNGVNNYALLRSAPNPTTAASGTNFIQINTNFTGYKAPVIEWDFLGGFRTSRFYQITASADGTTFNPVPTGVGSTVTVPGVGTATVSPTGLVEVMFVDGLIPATAPTSFPNYLTSLSFAFPANTVYDDNPNFKVRIAAVHAPTTAAYLSSFAGTDNTDTLKGYTNSSVAGGGTIRYDLIRVLGTQVPEPGTLAIAVCGAVAGWSLLRRKS